MRRKAPWRSKREGAPPHSKWCQLPIALFTRIHLGWETCTHTGEDPEINQIRTQNQAKQDDWSKETRKKCPIKLIQTATRVQISLSEPARVSIHTYCTHFPPNKHFSCFTTFCLYVEIHFFIADRPGPCHWPLVPGGLVARIPRSHCRCLTSISGGEPKSCFKPLQAEVTRITFSYTFPHCPHIFL